MEAILAGAATVLAIVVYFSVRAIYILSDRLERERERRALRREADRDEYLRLYEKIQTRVTDYIRNR